MTLEGAPGDSGGGIDPDLPPPCPHTEEARRGGGASTGGAEGHVGTESEKGCHRQLPGWKPPAPNTKLSKLKLTRSASSASLAYTDRRDAGQERGDGENRSQRFSAVRRRTKRSRPPFCRTI